MQATPEETQEGLAIVQVLSSVLDRLTGANASISRADPGHLTKFHAMKAPGISIQQYLERVQKYASCSNECFVLALIYVDRLIQRNNFILTELNVHRVVITAVMLAAKFFDDAYYNNAYYAKVGGVLVSEINGLEVDFLFRINFSLHVPPDEFGKYRAELLSHLGVNSSSPVPTLEPILTSPPQVSPEAGNCSVQMVTEPYMSMVSEPCSDVSATETASYITPSPPSSAAQMMDVNSNPGHYHEFAPIVHRSSSLPAVPVKQAQVYHQPMPSSAPRCVQPMGMMPQFPRPEHCLGKILYPAVSHHQHHMQADANNWSRAGM